MRTPQRMRRLLMTIRGVLLLAAPAMPPAWADPIETNVRLNFDVAGTLAAPIDTGVPFDEAVAGARLYNPRLGTRVFGEARLQGNTLVSMSTLDPGVQTPPGTDRDLLRVRVDGTLSAPVWDGATAIASGRRISCPGAFAQCNTSAVQWSDAFNTALPLLSSTPALGPLRVQATPTIEVLFPGAGVLDSSVRIAGSATMTARYESKSMPTYVSDALAATGGPPATRVRFDAAAQDVAALRIIGQDVSPVDANSQIHRIVPLRQAQGVLEVARDTAALREASGPAFASASGLVRDTWNVLREAPSLAPRDLAGAASGESAGSRLNELSAFLAAVQARDDASFTASLDANLAGLTIPTFSGGVLAPVATLDLNVLGGGAGELMLYATGNGSGGEAILALPNARRYAMVQQFMGLELLNGSGSVDFSTASGSGFTLFAGGGSEYIGENFGDVLRWDGGSGPMSLGFTVDGAQLYLVAAFDPVPVPVPGIWAPWAAAVLGIIAGGTRRRMASAPV